LRPRMTNGQEIFKVETLSLKDGFLVLLQNFVDTFLRLKESFCQVAARDEITDVKQLI